MSEQPTRCEICGAASGGGEQLEPHDQAVHDAHEQHLEELARQAREANTGLLPEPESGPVMDTLNMPGGEFEDGGYDIQPATDDGEIPGAEADDKVPVQTAFLVYVKMDGVTVAESDIEAALAKIRVMRPADLPDFRRCSHEVVDQVNTTLTVQTLINTQMAMAHQAAQQQQAAMMAAQIQQNGGLRGR